MGPDQLAIGIDVGAGKREKPGAPHTTRVARDMQHQLVDELPVGNVPMSPD